MASLSALLARDHAVPPQKIDEAIRRQATHGEDFETSLLEVGALGEDALAKYSALVFGATAARRDEVRAAEPGALARVSAALALRVRAVPLRGEGGRLLVAVSEPLSSAQYQELAAAAGATIEARVATRVRVDAALARHYGGALEPARARLVARLDEDPTPERASPSENAAALLSEARDATTSPTAATAAATTAAAPGLDRLKSSALQALAAILDDDEDDDEDEGAEDRNAERSAAPEPAVAASATVAAEPPPPAPADEASPAAPVDATPPASDAPAPAAPSASSAEVAAAAEPAETPASAPSPREEVATNSEATAELAASSTTDSEAVTTNSEATVERSEGAPSAREEVATNSEATAAPLEAPATSAASEHAELPEEAHAEALAATIAALAAADERDAVVGALLRFASAQARFAVAFVVQGSRAEALEARGEGALEGALEGRSIALDAPGALRDARDATRATLCRLEATAAPESPDGALLAALCAARGLPPPSALDGAALPVRVAGRAVLLLWVDAGPYGAPRSAAVGRIERAVAAASEAFERIVRERKARKARGAAPNAAPSTSAPAVAVAAPPEAAPPPSPPPPPAPPAAAPAPAPAPAPVAAPPEPEPPALVVEPAPEARDDGPLPHATEHQTGTWISPAALDASLPSTTSFARGGAEAPLADVIEGLPQGSEPYGQRRPPAVTQEEDLTDDTLRTVHEVVRTGALSDEQAARLLSAGDRALQAVFRYFPGPVRYDRSDAHAPRPAPSDAGPLLRLALLFRQASAPFLTALLDSVDPEQRYFAAWCLGELAHPPALERLYERLFDPDLPTRGVALEALRAHKRAPEFEHALRSLRALVADRGAPPERRRIAVRTLGELRDVDAVPTFIDALTDADTSLPPLAHAALVLLSRQDFGASVNDWRAWWQSASPRHRVEWLIDALLHPEGTLRHEASEELKKLTGQFFGYYFNLPRREREKAHRRYLEWWEREGRARSVR